MAGEEIGEREKCKNKNFGSTLLYKEDVYGMFKSIVLDTTGTKGDMDNDGIVDITDVILVLRKAIGLD